MTSSWAYAEDTIRVVSARLSALLVLAILAAVSVGNLEAFGFLASWIALVASER